MQLNQLEKNKYSEHILILCAGLGMGNASRISAIIESLDEENRKSNIDIRVSVFSWGAGIQYLKIFKEKSNINFKLYTLRSYKNINLLQFAYRYFLNCVKILRYISNNRPSLILLDSDYHLAAYLGNRIPKYYLGQAFNVLRTSNKLNYRPSNIMETLNFVLREKFDFFYQVITSDLIFVPSIYEFHIKSSKIIRTPLIVRRCFLENEELKKKPEQDLMIVGVLLSGSGIEKEQFINLKKSAQFDFLLSNQGNNLILTTANQVDSYSALITQGGLSSISEVLSRGKFILVLPMKNHPEQILNAMTIEKLKIGIFLKHNDLEDPNKLHDKILASIADRNKMQIDCSGAKLIATYLINFFYDEFKKNRSTFLNS